MKPSPDLAPVGRVEAMEWAEVQERLSIVRYLDAQAANIRGQRNRLPLIEHVVRGRLDNLARLISLLASEIADGQHLISDKIGGTSAEDSDQQQLPLSGQESKQ